MICVSIQNKDYQEILEILKEVEMAEIRLDRCALEDEEIEALFADSDVPLVATCVALEQFGYGFGFTAYTMYLIYIARGEHKTAHYAIGTAFMAAGMMFPGMAAGWISDQIGYTLFFVWACLCTIPGIIAALLVRKRIPADFGTKKE